MLSEQEIQWNLKYAEDALAQQRLEGLETSKDFILDLDRAAHGEMTVQEVVDNIKRRYGHGKILEPRPLS